MSKIGIKSVSALNLISGINFKRDVLIFDKVIVERDAIFSEEQTELLEIYSSLRPESQRNSDSLSMKFNMNELEFLTANKVIEIVEIPEFFAKDTIQIKYKQAYDEFRLSEKYWHETVRSLNLKLEQTGDVPTLRELEHIQHLTAKHYCRMLWVDALIKGYDNYFPILDDANSHHLLSTNLNKDLVFEVVLKNMPVPTDDTSWEQILDFKNSPQLKAKYNSLIHWINNVAKEQLTLGDFEDYYNHLYSEYVQEFERHEIKHRPSWLRILLVGTGALIDNVARFKYENIATAICDFIEKRTELLEMEKDFKGRELAYIYSANKSFKD